MTRSKVDTSVGLSRFKIGVIAISYFLLNGILFCVLIWSILFKANLGFSGKADSYFQLVDFLNGLKWLSLAGLGVSWVLGYLALDSTESRLLRWFVKGTVILFFVLLILFLFFPSH